MEHKVNLIVYGATPAGIVCAVRASREGLSVLLVSRSHYIGGMLSNGLSVMDTLYAGARSPLYDELRRSIHDYYRIKYGPDSQQFAASRPGHPKTYYEAHVVEHIMNQWVDMEFNITTALGMIPVQVVKKGTHIEHVVFKSIKDETDIKVFGDTFVDCSYEADLAVVAGVPYRVGREARSEFNEKHAGRIFMRRADWPPQHVDPDHIQEYKKLNLYHYDRWFDIVDSDGSGEADASVQAFNIRAVLTTNVANQAILQEPPVGYDPKLMAQIWKEKPQYSQLLGPLPNDKYLWNMPELLGPQHEYPDGDWSKREEIIERHRQATRGMLYFLQNDTSIDPEVRQEWRKLGFARDEFVKNGNLPYEVYARETRRIVGRSVFTENDATLVEGIKRTPIYPDSISITEWFLDVHACNNEKIGNSLYEGEIYLNYVSHPAQISYQTLLVDEADNFLVPVCLSCSHIGWGAIRLEPTWMSIAEAVSHAAVLALEKGMPPREIVSDELVRRLADRRIMVSFFNDVAIEDAEPWIASVQYFGTQGFFSSYDANPRGVLTKAMAVAWTDAAIEWLTEKPVDILQRAQSMFKIERQNSKGVITADFIKLLIAAMEAADIPFNREDLVAEIGLGADKMLTRSNACHIIYKLGNCLSEAKAKLNRPQYKVNPDTFHEIGQIKSK